MAIRMRLTKRENERCDECGKISKLVLEMYDLQIGNHVHIVCDECNEKIFNVTLRAQVKLNGKVKSKRDLAIINRRGRREESK